MTVQRRGLQLSSLRNDTVAITLRNLRTRGLGDFSFSVAVATRCNRRRLNAWKKEKRKWKKNEKIKRERGRREGKRGRER